MYVCIFFKRKNLIPKRKLISETSDLILRYNNITSKFVIVTANYLE